MKSLAALTGAGYCKSIQRDGGEKAWADEYSMVTLLIGHWASTMPNRIQAGVFGLADKPLVERIDWKHERDRLTRSTVNGILQSLEAANAFERHNDVVHSIHFDKLTAVLRGWAAKIVEPLLRCYTPELLAEVDDQGDTALHYAVYTQCPAMAKMLVDAGAQPLQPNKRGLSPLHASHIRDTPDVTEMLRMKPAPAYSKKSGKTMLRQGAGSAADVQLSNGKSDGSGYALAECQAECSTQAKCKSFLWTPSDGNCELWSKSGPTAKSKDGSSLYVKRKGRRRKSTDQAHARRQTSCGYPPCPRRWSAFQWHSGRGRQGGCGSACVRWAVLQAESSLFLLLQRSNGSVSSPKMTRAAPRQTCALARASSPPVHVHSESKTPVRTRKTQHLMSCRVVSASTDCTNPEPCIDKSYARRPYVPRPGARVQ